MRKLILVLLLVASSVASAAPGWEFPWSKQELSILKVNAEKAGLHAGTGPDRRYNEETIIINHYLKWQSITTMGDRVLNEAMVQRDDTKVLRRLVAYTKELTALLERFNGLMLSYFLLVDVERDLKLYGKESQERTVELQRNLFTTLGLTKNDRWYTDEARAARKKGREENRSELLEDARAYYNLIFKIDRYLDHLQYGK